MLKNSMESVFTEDFYYQLAGYGSGLQDAAGMIRFPLHCVAKAVCGHITKPFFPRITLPVSWGILPRAPAFLALTFGGPWFLLGADPLQ